MTIPPVIPTLDGLALHDLSLAADNSGPTVLFAHATGFHGRCWQPVADALPQCHAIAYDARAHGDSPAPHGWVFDWNALGADAAMVAEYLVAGDPLHAPLVAVGHSMGGAALLLAAASRPELFRALIVYEPIVMPPLPAGSTPSANGNFLATGARRRRSAFESFEAALANYGAKPPLNIFTPAALEAYVRGGFRAGDDGQVHLKCLPENEARTYEGAPAHRAWEQLPRIQLPVWVLCGLPEAGQPSAFQEQLCQRLPNGRYVQLDHLGHFGPMQAPAEIAALVTQACAEPVN